MNRQFQHAMLPLPVHDEQSRQDFVHDYKVHVLSVLGPRQRAVYEEGAKPAFERAERRLPESRRDIDRAMKREPSWKMWSSLNRTGQELMWDAISDTAFRERDRLVAQGRRLRASKGTGALKVDKSLEVPRYIAAVDIHNQPGGYGLVLGDDDVYAGSLYDLSAHHYSLGGLNPMGSDPGDSTVAFLRERYPDLKPRRILDIGCSVGASTLPLADAYPDAEVHAIDVAETFVRYADARAKDLGRNVCFAQMNAEKTDYPDGYFDLVVSHLFFHETSARALRNVMAEAHRLLAPSGVMIHSDVPESNQFHPDAYDQWWRDWTTHYNAEPYRSTLRDSSLSAASVAAGFDPAKVYETKIGSAAAAGTYKKTHGYGAEWHLVVTICATSSRSSQSSARRSRADAVMRMQRRRRFALAGAAPKPITRSAV